ncbi:GTP1 OBG domain containing protein [Trichuris trichiura]|uniref:GTP1 OBG domain containing protein n=1 Tax=Trichuris trichiura TaxID=36087 RepID=A0A077Z018_TRITR|nr:GTP1 OBG domain containing protein [Trichuris trichiura]
MCSSVDEAISLFKQFRHCYFLTNPDASPEEFLAATTARINLLLDELESSKDKLDRTTYCFLRGKLLNMLPEYSAECEACLRVAVDGLQVPCEALNELGNCIFKKGDLWLAKSCFEASLLHKRNTQALRDLAIVLRDRRISARLGSKNVKNSLALTREAYCLDPEDDFLGNALMIEFFNSSQCDGGLVEEAIQFYAMATKSDATKYDADLYYNQGSVTIASLLNALRYAENYEGAYKSLQYALLLNPHSASTRSELKTLCSFLRNCQAEVERKGHVRRKRLSQLATSAVERGVLGAYGKDKVLKAPSVPSLKHIPLRKVRTGNNSGFIVSGTVVAIVRNEKIIPYAFCIMDAVNDECFVVTVYNFAENFGVMIEQSVAILEPFVYSVRFDMDGELKGGGTLLRDHLRVYVRGGKGGQGLKRYNGIGGDGGDVLLEASEKVTLERLATQNPSRRFVAGRGQDSKKFQLIGDKGENKVVKVPVGITVKTDEGKLIRDLYHAGDQLLVATGGLGGCASNDYKGAKPTSYIIRLDLKLIADVGLVGTDFIYRMACFDENYYTTGYFNLFAVLVFVWVILIGQLLSACIFILFFTTLCCIWIVLVTTVRPQLGIIEYDDGRQISVADLPGLIEGAYLNVGMGHNFLKHVERTYLLLFIIDITGFKLNVASPFRSAFETFLLLTKEIELYMPELLDKPCVVCLNKMDMANSKACFRSFMHSFNALYEKGASDSELPVEIRPSRFVKPKKLWAISAKKHENIQPVITHLRESIDQLDEEKRKLKTLPTDLLDFEDTGPLLL